MSYIKKIITKCLNHEIWTICKLCGLEYDARLCVKCDTCK